MFAPDSRATRKPPQASGDVSSASKPPSGRGTPRVHEAARAAGGILLLLRRRSSPERARTPSPRRDPEGGGAQDARSRPSAGGGGGSPRLPGFAQPRAT